MYFIIFIIILLFLLSINNRRESFANHSSTNYPFPDFQDNWKLMYYPYHPYNHEQKQEALISEKYPFQFRNYFYKRKYPINNQKYNKCDYYPYSYYPFSYRYYPYPYDSTEKNT